MGKELPVIERKPPLKISRESLDCIIEQAGYGIGYWATSATQDDAARTYTIIEADDDPGTAHVLSYEKIEEVFWKIADYWQEVKVNTTIRNYFFLAVSEGMVDGKGDIDAGHMDADAADVLMQFACFGEIVYG